MLRRSRGRGEQACLGVCACVWCVPVLVWVCIVCQMVWALGVCLLCCVCFYAVVGVGYVPLLGCVHVSVGVGVHPCRTFHTLCDGVSAWVLAGLVHVNAHTVTCVLTKLCAYLHPCV